MKMMCAHSFEACQNLGRMCYDLADNLMCSWEIALFFFLSCAWICLRSWESSEMLIYECMCFPSQTSFAVRVKCFKTRTHDSFFVSTLFTIVSKANEKKDRVRTHETRVARFVAVRQRRKIRREQNELHRGGRDERQGVATARPRKERPPKSCTRLLLRRDCFASGVLNIQFKFQIFLAFFPSIQSSSQDPSCPHRYTVDKPRWLISAKDGLIASLKTTTRLPSRVV